MARIATKAGLAALLAAMAATVWALAGAQRSQSAVVDLLVVRSESGATVFDAQTETVTVGVPGGVPSPDESTIVHAESDGQTTVLTATDTAGGQTRWARELHGDLAVLLVAADGETVVLGPSHTATDLYRPEPRFRTHLVVSRPDGSTFEYSLRGNFEPEALSTDGQSLFVISYIPPTAPEAYQVRRLDLRTGEVVDVFTPDAELQQEMGGTARTQVWAPDASRLYTLYTLDRASHAFIHVLDLDELWAHCIDLPAPLGATDETATMLAMHPDGDRLYIADRAAGLIGEVDTEALQLLRTAPLKAQPNNAPASGTVTPDRRLLLGVGARVDVIALDSLEHTATWPVPAGLVGLHLRSDGKVLAVLADRRVVVLDPDTGDRLNIVTIPGRPPVDAIGGTTTRVQDVDKDDDVLDCAC
jgi:hypothetical protein